MRKAAGPKPVVNALVRGLEVLRCFDYSRQSLGSSEIARLAGLPQPTVWRLCKTLEREGYLVADAGGARFRPGLAVLTLGYAALGTLDLAELARPPLQEIADRFRGAAGLSTRERLAMLYLQRCEGANAFLNVNLRVGSEIPIATSGTGWAYLAGLAPDAREALVAEIRRRQPEQWRRAEKPFRKALEDYGKVGYVTNLDVFFNGLTTVATPIGGPVPKALYVLNCSVLTPVLGTEKLRREAGLALLDAAKRLAPVLERPPRRG
jgi:DNA-binding IclR family transcriptional regulator